MKLILLSGNSYTHKEWIEQVEDSLRDLFDSTYIQYYKHWEDKSPVIHLDHELDVLKTAVDPKDPEYVVFAKSAGTLLALSAVNKGIFKPKRCIFVGLPVVWGRTNGFEVDSWIQDYSINTLFIQKTHDPAMFFSDLELYLQDKKVVNSSLVELPGDDHYYGDLALLKAKIAEFLNF